MPTQLENSLSYLRFESQIPLAALPLLTSQFLTYLGIRLKNINVYFLFF